MITLISISIILPLVLFFLFIKLAFHKTEKEAEKAKESLVNLTIIIFFLGFIPPFLIPQKSETIIQRYELESIKNNNSIAGSVFLGSGYIENRIKYTYYYKEGDFYKIGSEPVDICKIKYITGKPYLEIYTDKKSDTHFKHLSLRPVLENRRVVFYIPEGSIENNYKLDLK
jgi:hypothetical protein